MHFNRLLFCAALALPALGHALDLRSRDFNDGGALGAQQLYQGFGCTGGNRSPQLAWRDAPAGTKSFVITAYDPDAPTGSGWWHWVVFDLPAATRSLESGAGQADGTALPAGARQGRNDFGTQDFGGACPPAGDKPHRYVFTVHALKVEKLDVPADASPALIGFMVHANRIGSAQVTARYGR
ncbi:phospholipid-binding protein, PBP family [Pseudoduganella lurida]|uniref:Phospholipid-binding protein, PBP family n=1 Tax=Pseudoduganella lurida TaxID=1036180 RepID=A0A562QY90_9BURK|nr:YbhB/YbcL family Raf kinase inhibitor-like protein [Pseudoduganella lurida]TWI61553.1 phospholipid-binding protein, PBP family [Pseudoduganella lurida]